MRSPSTICCYLCGVLLFGLVMLSVISIAPEGESFFTGVAILEAVAAAVFALLAVVFRRRTTTPPLWLITAFQTFAVALTFLVLLFSVG